MRNTYSLALIYFQTCKCMGGLCLQEVECYIQCNIWSIKYTIMLKILCNKYRSTVGCGTLAMEPLNHCIYFVCIHKSILNSCNMNLINASKKKIKTFFKHLFFALSSTVEVLKSCIKCFFQASFFRFIFYSWNIKELH